MGESNMNTIYDSSSSSSSSVSLLSLSSITSINVDLFIDTIKMFDLIVREYRSCNTNSHSNTNDDYFKKRASDLVSVISFIMIEIVAYLAMSSMRAFLSLVSSENLLNIDTNSNDDKNNANKDNSSNNNNKNNNMNGKYEMLISSIRLLITSSSLLLSSLRAEITHEISLAVRLLPNRYVTVDISQYLDRSLQKIPSFVINLDRRYDRWKILLRTSEQHGIIPMRISAVDGLDMSINIPVSDVTKIWDTTLNAAFDSHCLEHIAQCMTDSERACAASHLMIWRLISKIRKGVISNNQLFRIPVDNNDKSIDSNFDANEYGVSATSTSNFNIIQDTLLRSRFG